MFVLRQKCQFSIPQLYIFSLVVVFSGLKEVLQIQIQINFSSIAPFM